MFSSVCLIVSIVSTVSNSVKSKTVSVFVCVLSGLSCVCVVAFTVASLLLLAITVGVLLFFFFFLCCSS